MMKQDESSLMRQGKRRQSNSSNENQHVIEFHPTSSSRPLPSAAVGCHDDRPDADVAQGKPGLRNGASVASTGTRSEPRENSDKTKAYLSSSLTTDRPGKHRRVEKSDAWPRSSFATIAKSKGNVDDGSITTWHVAPIKRRKPISNVTRDDKWLSSFQELETYKAEHGDCLVRRPYSENARLANWVAEQRKQYKLLKDGKPSSINQERISLLEGIGFAWSVHESTWCRRIQDLKKFRQENGHCNVPLNYDQEPKLRPWVKEQRQQYQLMKQGKQSPLTRDRIAELDSIGFCWNTQASTWWKRLKELSQYKKQFGTCAVPTNYPENPQLGTWVHHQRMQYKYLEDGKSTHLTEERIRALEDLGFVWYPREVANRTSSDGNIEQLL